jgi:predicted amidohydrolase
MSDKAFEGQTGSQAYKVAVVQHCAGTDVERNLTTLETLSRQAANEGAQFITWAEAFARCQALARELHCALLLGGFHEAMPGDPERCYNTSVYLSEDGEIQALYRKIHLFDVDIEGGPTLQESKQTASGDQAVVVETGFGTLGLTVCYDVRFPALYQRLVDMGAIATSVPSAFTATTGAMHWHPLLRARAIETQGYVIAPAQHGQHSKHRASYGHSVIIDPWGKIVAEIDAGDGYAIAEVDPAQVARVRTEIPSLANRQPFQ